MYIIQFVLFYAIVIATVAATDEIDKKIFSILDKNSLNSKRYHTCKNDTSFSWCIPPEYNKDVEPWKHRTLTNLTLPWYYFYEFNIFEVLEVNDKVQTMALNMYFTVKWYEPRMKINVSSIEWKNEALKVAGEEYVPVPIDHLDYFWIPDPEIHWIKSYRTHPILRPSASLRISSKGLFRYLTRVNVVISCQMNFENYPFDSQRCHFTTSSFYYTEETVGCASNISFNHKHQRNLQYMLNVSAFKPEHNKLIEHNGLIFATCGFRIDLKRKIQKIIFQMFIPSTLLLIISWVSFIVDPKIVPGRMGLIVTIFLVLVNIFIGVQREAPRSSGLHAADVFLVVCLGEVFAAFLEYALVLCGFGRNRNSSASTLVSSNEVSVSADTLPQQPNRSNVNLQIPTNGWMKIFQKTTSEIERNVLDRISLILFPISFATFLVFYLYHYIE